MPSTAEHQALYRVLREDEVLFTRAMARAFNVMEPAPPGGVTMLSTKLTDAGPRERSPGSVLQVQFMVEDTAGPYILALQSQGEPDEARRRWWPYFIACLQEKYQCPVILAVVCTKGYTARWASAPIETGVPGLVCQTTSLVVFGPDTVPAITDPAEAASDLMLAVLSAFAHSRGKKAGAIVQALATALTTIDEATAANLAEFTGAGLGHSAGAQAWREIMAARAVVAATAADLPG